MQISNSVDVTDTLKNGKKLYGKHMIPFMRYALLSVLVSQLVPFYVAVFNTFFTDYLLIYVLGLIFLMLLYFPIVYYSIIITITNAEKLKSIYRNDDYDYRQGFHNSRDKFWRVFFVMFVRFILKLIAVFAIMLPVFYFIGKANPEAVPMTIGTVSIPMLMAVSGVGLIFSVYFLVRTEFAAFVVYWDIKVIENEFKTSMMLTKHEFIKKLKIIIVAHLPGLTLSLTSLMYIFLNLEDIHPMIRWIYIGATLGVNLLLYSWRYAFYFPLLDGMKCLVSENKTTIDEKGREWLSF